MSRALTGHAQAAVQASLARIRDLRDGSDNSSGPGLWLNRFDERFLQWRIRFEPANDPRFRVPELGGLSANPEVFEPLRPEIRALWEAAKQRATPAAGPTDGGAGNDHRNSEVTAMARSGILHRYPNATFHRVRLEKSDFTVFYDRLWPAQRFQAGDIVYQLPEEEGFCRLQRFHYAERFELWKGGYRKPPPPEQNESFFGSFRITLCPK